MLSSFEIENISIETLMLQSGYLTINSVQNVGDTTFYELRYPNREVYQSLNNSLLKNLVMDAGKQVKNRISLHKLLMENDFDGLKALFQSFYSSIP